MFTKEEIKKYTIEEVLISNKSLLKKYLYMIEFVKPVY